MFRRKRQLKACDYDKEVEALLSQMTLDEKIGQLNQRTVSA